MQTVSEYAFLRKHFFGCIGSKSSKTCFHEIEFITWEVFPYLWAMLLRYRNKSESLWNQGGYIVNLSLTVRHLGVFPFPYPLISYFCFALHTANNNQVYCFMVFFFFFVTFQFNNLGEVNKSLWDATPNLQKRNVTT